MKIAINTRFLLKHQMEGVGRFIYETCKRLAQQHPEDEFHFFFDRKYDPSFVFTENVKPYIIHPQARSPLLWKYWFEIAIPYYLRKVKAEVFLSPDTYMSLKTNVPTALVSHDIAYAHFPEHIPGPALKYYLKYFPKYHQAAKRVIAVSEYTRQDIIKQYQLDPAKVVVAHNAVPSHFTEISISKKQDVRDQYSDGFPYLLYVGSIHPRKNIKNLIRAFSSFKKESGLPHKLLLAGRMAWKVGEIKKTADESAFSNDIIFLHHIEQGLEKIMASADALVYVSLHEGFGIPVLEAMHCNIPVICSNKTSLPEVAGDAAILVDPMNIAEIADAMYRVLMDDSLREALIERGKKQRQKFNWDKTTETIYSTLKEIVQDKV